MFLLIVVTVVEGLDRYIREDFTSQIFGVNTITLRRSESIQINTTREESRERRPPQHSARELCRHQVLEAGQVGLKLGWVVPFGDDLENRWWRHLAVVL